MDDCFLKTNTKIEYFGCCGFFVCGDRWVDLLSDGRNTAKHGGLLNYILLLHQIAQAQEMSIYIFNNVL